MAILGKMLELGNDAMLQHYVGEFSIIRRRATTMFSFSAIRLFEETKAHVLIVFLLS